MAQQERPERRPFAEARLKLQSSVSGRYQVHGIKRAKQTGSWSLSTVPSLSWMRNGWVERSRLGHITHSGDTAIAARRVGWCAELPV